MVKCCQGVFCIDELQSPEGFYLMKENVINKTENLISEAIGTDRKRKIVEVFDEVRVQRYFDVLLTPSNFSYQTHCAK